MQWGSADGDGGLYVRTVIVGGRRFVLAPFIHATWVKRDRAYRQRRRICSS